MTFSYNPANIGSETIDRVRFLLGDTVTPGHFLEDEELVVLLASATTAREAAALSAEHLAARFARFADQSAGRVSVKYSQLNEQWLRTADKIRQGGTGQFVEPYVGGVEKTDIQLDHENANVKNAVFSRGFDAHPGTDQDQGQHDHDHDHFF